MVLATVSLVILSTCPNQLDRLYFIYLTIFSLLIASSSSSSTENRQCFNIQGRGENQLDATECFIAHIICSTCFGHLYAHYQELETILVLLPHMVCNSLVAGGRLLGAEQQDMRPG
jgi:hypothetical protein